MSQPARKAVQKSAAEGFTDEEKAAMKARLQELKAEARVSKNREEGKKLCLRRLARCRSQTAPWQCASMRSSPPPQRLRLAPW